MLGDSALARRFMRMRAAVDTSRATDWFYSWLLAQAAADSAGVERLWHEPPDDVRTLFDVTRVALDAGPSGTEGLRAVRRVAQLPDFAASPITRTALYNWGLTIGDTALARESLLRAYPDSAGEPNPNRLVLEVRAANVGMGEEAAARAAAAGLGRLDADPLSSDTIIRARQRAATRVLEPWRLLRGMRDAMQPKRVTVMPR